MVADNIVAPIEEAVELLDGVFMMLAKIREMAFQLMDLVGGGIVDGGWMIADGGIWVDVSWAVDMG